MYVEKQNNRTVMDAFALQMQGHHQQAAELFQRAGNQIRNPAEKRELWDYAERARQIARSD